MVKAVLPTEAPADTTTSMGRGSQVGAGESCRPGKKGARVGPQEVKKSDNGKEDEAILCQQVILYSPSGKVS